MGTSHEMKISLGIQLLNMVTLEVFIVGKYIFHYLNNFFLKLEILKYFGQLIRNLIGGIFL